MIRLSRRLGVLGLVTFTVACGFPSVKFSPAVDGAAEDDADLEADASDAALDTGIPDAGPDAKPMLLDSGNPCDKDGDGYKSEACGGDDCDDIDSRANKGVTTFKYFSPVEPTFGDWNCNHSVEPQITTFNLNCGAYLTLTTTCSSLSGYTGPGPACGSFATWVTCKNGLTNCAIDQMKSVQQACK